MAEESKVDETTGLLNTPLADAPQPAAEENRSETNNNPLETMETTRSTNAPPIDKTKTLKKKKKKRIKMTKTGAMMVERQVQMMMTKHNLAARFFGFRQFWFFTIPQAILATIASILAFVATTDLIDEATKILLNTIVGSTSAVVVFVQTISGICNYSTRSSMHEAASVDLRNLRDDLVMLQFKLNLGKNRGGNVVAKPAHQEDEEDADDDEDNTDLDMNFGEIRSRFLQTLSGCKSNVPMPLMEAFHGVKSNLMVGESKSTSEYFSQVYEDSLDICYERMGFKVYDILAAEILEHPFFPLILPDPKKVVERTMQRLRKEMMTYNSFWVDGVTEVEYGCFQLPCFP